MKKYVRFPGLWYLMPVQSSNDYNIFYEFRVINRYHKAIMGHILFIDGKNALHSIEEHEVHFFGPAVVGINHRNETIRYIAMGRKPPSLLWRLLVSFIIWKDFTFDKRSQ